LKFLLVDRVNSEFMSKWGGGRLLIGTAVVYERMIEVWMECGRPRAAWAGAKLGLPEAFLAN